MNFSSKEFIYKKQRLFLIWCNGGNKYQGHFLAHEKKKIIFKEKATLLHYCLTNSLEINDKHYELFKSNVFDFDCIEKWILSPNDCSFILHELFNAWNVFIDFAVNSSQHEKHFNELTGKNIRLYEKLLKKCNHAGFSPSQALQLNEQELEALSNIMKYGLIMISKLIK